MIRSSMLRGLTAALAAVLVFLNSAPSSSQQASSEAAKLLGKWVSQTDFGVLALEFRSATQLVFAGEPASYRLLPEVIRIEDEEGTADYRYSFRGEILVLSFPAGFQLEFRRVEGLPKAPVEKPAAEGPSPAPAAPPETDQVGDPSWGFAFQPPAGWKFEKNAAAVILGHDSVAGMILVLPHQATTLEEVQRQMQEGLDEEGARLSPTSQIRSSGNNILTADYAGVFGGQQVKAAGLGTLSPFGGGAFIMAVTTPQQFGRELSAAAETIARGMHYSRVEASELMSYLAGTWVTMTKNTETRAVLTAEGEYYSSYESSYSGRLEGGGSWGHAADSRERGRWTVRGDRRQGVIVITYGDGSQEQIEYRVQVSKGETYWNEYWFNDQLHARQR